MAYTTLVAGTTITAAWANGSVRDQSVSPFASAAARSSAISSPVEGMVSHLNDVNSLGVYSGAAWSTVGPVSGALTSWTPTWTQSATITKTVTQATYSRVGRQITASLALAATSAGTAANVILLGLPVAAVTGASVVGTVLLLDANLAVYDYGSAFLSTSTTFGVVIHGGTGLRTGLGGGLNAIASGDLAYATLSYEASADA